MKLLIGFIATLLAATLSSPLLAQSAPKCPGPGDLAIEGISVERIEVGSGLLLVFQKGDVKGALWAGFMPDGRFVTFHRTLRLTSGSDDPNMVRAIEGLIERLAKFRDCPDLAAQEKDADSASKVVSEVVQAKEAAPLRPFDLTQWVVPVAVTCSLLAYIFLSLAEACRSIRRQWRVALAVGAIALLAFTWRVVVAPRVPMVAATADATRLGMGLSFLDDPSAWSPGGYPPGLGVILGLLFMVTGPSIDAAFFMTTAIGALTVIPTFLLAGELLDFRASVFAGLALAFLPLHVLFSNGCNMVIPAAYLLVASFHHFLKYTRGQRLMDGLLYCLSMVLFVQMRPEGALQAFPVLAAQVAIAAWGGDIGKTLRSRRTYLLAVLGLVLLMPYVYRTLAEGNPQYTYRHPAAQSLAPTCGLAIVAIVAVPWIPWFLLRKATLGKLITGAVILATIANISYAINGEGLVDVLLPSWPATLSLPEGWYEMKTYHRSYFLPRQTIFLDPRMFPLLWLPLLGLGLAWFSEGHFKLGVGALAFIALTVVFSNSGASGEIIAKDPRLAVPVCGLVCTSVALGAEWLVRRLKVGSRRPLNLLIGALLVVPASTHFRVVSDILFNEQRQFLFMKEGIPLLEEGDILVLPDHIAISDETHEESGVPIWSTSRMDHLMEVFNRVTGRPQLWLGLSEWACEETEQGRAIFFHNLDCYRTQGHGEASDCKTIRLMTGSEETLLKVEFQNRPYSFYPMIDENRLELSLLVLGHDPKKLKAMLRERGVCARHKTVKEFRGR